MTSREYLTQLKRLRDLMEEEQADLDDEREEAETDLPVDGKEGYLKRIEILERVYERHKEIYPKMKERIRRKILTLKNKRERAVLIMRYVDLLEWDQIAKNEYTTQDAVFALHQRALKKLIV